MAARAAAVRLLHEVLTLGRSLDEVFARQVQALAPPDRALAHALAAQALRWLVDLDRLIDSASARPLPADARARQVLRIALAGRLRLKTPMHATIATALALLQGGPRRLCHAVLARLDREGATLPELPTLPVAWAERWESRFKPSALEAMRAALGTIPPTDLSLRNPDETTSWATRLAGQSIEPGHVQIAGSQRVEALPGLAEGAFWVQDLAARQVVRRLGDVGGRPVLDLCAAPGGKTLQLAAAGAHVTAVDRAAYRMARLEAHLARTGLSARTVVADLLEWEPDQLFGFILLDAPCSATGTFRRHPEVLARRHPRELPGLAERQRQMLARSANWLAPGGRLVYAVCSLEPEEGEEVVERTAGQGLALLATERLLPGTGPGDGFFIATFAKAGA
ncbi:RsmB/NOP family class I SAM-dependent RNA methyltransferase [Thermaurantiacus sp.]